MAKYDRTLRPRKNKLNKRYWGKFGTFDFTEEGILWKDMPQEALIEFCAVHNKKTIETHLIGDLPQSNVKKEVSKAPDTDGKK